MQHETAKIFVLGAGWRLATHEDGSATFYNNEKHQCMTLSSASFATLKALVRVNYVPRDAA